MSQTDNFTNKEISNFEDLSIQIAMEKSHPRAKPKSLLKTKKADRIVLLQKKNTSNFKNFCKKFQKLEGSTIKNILNLSRTELSNLSDTKIINNNEKEKAVIENYKIRQKNYIVGAKGHSGIDYKEKVIVQNRVNKKSNKNNFFN